MVEFHGREFDFSAGKKTSRNFRHKSKRCDNTVTRPSCLASGINTTIRHPSPAPFPILAPGKTVSEIPFSFSFSPDLNVIVSTSIFFALLFFSSFSSSSHLLSLQRFPASLTSFRRFFFSLVPIGSSIPHQYQHRTSTSTRMANRSVSWSLQEDLPRSHLQGLICTLSSSPYSGFIDS